MIAFCKNICIKQEKAKFAAFLGQVCDVLLIAFEIVSCDVLQIASGISSCDVLLIASKLCSLF